MLLDEETRKRVELVVGASALRGDVADDGVLEASIFLCWVASATVGGWGGGVPAVVVEGDEDDDLSQGRRECFGEHLSPPLLLLSLAAVAPAAAFKSGLAEVPAAVPVSILA